MTTRAALGRAGVATDPLLDLAGLVAAYGLPRATWRRAIYRGELPHLKFGARDRAKTWVRRSAVESWLAAHEVRG